VSLIAINIFRDRADVLFIIIVIHICDCFSTMNDTMFNPAK
jgi:hypothetical protein